MTPLLDKHASRVSAPTLNVAGNARQAPPNLNKTALKAGVKKQRHKLRRAAGKALPYERVVNSGQSTMSAFLR